MNHFVSIGFISFEKAEERVDLGGRLKAIGKKGKEQWKEKEKTGYV